MHERVLYRIGSVSLFSASVLGVLLNLLHPRVPAYTDPEDLVLLAAESTIWLGDHIGFVLFALLALGGLAAIYRSVITQPGAAWARLGFVGALVGASLLLVLVALDGIAFKEAADAWHNAPATEKEIALRIAVAVEDFAFGLFSIFIIVGNGVTPILYGLAFLTSSFYPKWLGWLLIVAGCGLTLIGLMQAYNGPSVLVTNVLFPAFSIPLTLAFFVAAIVLWRRASGAA